MALTFPTPPTPPTPPQAPKVVLEGGGSVTEMPRPKSYGPTSGDAINEQKARDAVAKGGGALSKTTTTKDDSRNTNVEGSVPGATDNAKTNANTRENTDKPLKPKTKVEQDDRTGDKYIDLKEFQADDRQNQQQQQTQAMTQTQPFRVKNADSSHGVLYWGFTIISVLALLVYLAKKFLIKNTENKYSFSKRDLSYLTEDEEKPVQENLPKRPLNAVKNYETQEKSKPREAISKNKEVKQAKQPKQEAPHFEVRV